MDNPPNGATVLVISANCCVASGNSALPSLAKGTALSAVTANWLPYVIPRFSTTGYEYRDVAPIAINSPNCGARDPSDTESLMVTSSPITRSRSEYCKPKKIRTTAKTPARDNHDKRLLEPYNRHMMITISTGKKN